MTAEDRGQSLWMGLAAVAVVISLFLFIGDAPVRRTQEARVAETARQMLGQPLERWLLPQINGEARLQKPPLAYWMTAASYKILGVGEGAARVPSVIAGCFAAVAVCGIGAALGDRRAGQWAGFFLLTTFLGFRWARLAETDMPSIAGMFAAWWLWLRAVQTDGTGRAAAFAAGAGVTLGLGFLAKHGPPFMIFGLLVASWPVIRGAGKWRWKRIGMSTALMLLTAVLTAAWWFIMAKNSPHGSQLGAEIGVVASGQDHHATVWGYLPQYFGAMMPWTLLPLAALFTYGGWRQTWRERIRGVAAIDRSLGLAFFLTAIPLLFLGNKQIHYLLPLVPIGALVCGRVVAGVYGWSLRARSGFCSAVAAASVVMALAVPTMQLYSGKPVRWLLTLAVVALLVPAAIGFARRRSGNITIGLSLAVATFAGCWSILFAKILPELEKDNTRDLARQIAADIGDRPLMFLGSERSLPLCFALRREILPYETAARDNRPIPADVFLIDESPADGKAEPSPPGFHVARKITSPKRVFTLYEQTK